MTNTSVLWISWNHSLTHFGQAFFGSRNHGIRIILFRFCVHENKPWNQEEKQLPRLGIHPSPSNDQKVPSPGKMFSKLSLSGLCLKCGIEEKHRGGCVFFIAQMFGEDFFWDHKKWCESHIFQNMLKRRIPSFCWLGDKIWYISCCPFVETMSCTTHQSDFQTKKSLGLANQLF